MARRAATVWMNVCVRVSVRSAADRRGVTAGQVEAVFAVEQHLLLVTLDVERGENRCDHLSIVCFGIWTEMQNCCYLTVQGLTVRALLMNWNCSIPDCRKD